MSEIKKGMKDKKLVIGTGKAIKSMKLGKLVKILLSSNCPTEVRADIASQSKACSCEVVELGIPNDELGVICKKQFSVSVLGMLK